MVFDVGGLGDKGFNDSANDALQAAAKNMGIDHQQLEPSADGSNRGELLRSLAEDGYGMIVGVGFALRRGHGDGRGRLPGHQVRDRRRVVDAPNVTGARVRRRSRAPSSSAPRRRSSRAPARSGSSVVSTVS